MESIRIKTTPEEMFPLLTPDSARLDAIQGGSEAQTELYTEVQQGSTGTADKVMRQESGQAAELGSEVGQDGEGVWNA